MKQVIDIIDSSKNKLFVLALVLFVYFTTFQISSTSNQFKSSSDFYTYFLAIGALIALVKTFLISYKVILDKFFDTSHSLLVLINIFTSSAIIWLMNAAVLTLTQTSYPRDFFALLSISTGLFLFIKFINGIKSSISLISIALVYNIMVYVILWLQWLEPNILLFQLTAAGVVIFEILQINQTIRIK